MAGELQLQYSQTVRTVYFQVWNAIGQIWRVDNVAFENYATANISHYNIAATEKGTASMMYEAAMPVNSAGVFQVTGRLQAGGSPAEADLVIGQGVVQWSGSLTQPLYQAPVNVVEVDGVALSTHVAGMFPADLRDIAGAAVDTTAAQLGVNVVNFGGSAGTFSSGKPSIKLAATDVTGNVATDLQTIKTQTVTCSASVTVGAFVGNATAALAVDASGRVDLGKILGTASAGAVGYVGVDWGHVNAPTTTVGLTGTTIATSQVVASVTGAVGSVASGGITRASFAADTGLQTIRSNTAAAGSSTTLTLDASASSVNSFYVNDLLLLTGGTGAGQARSIRAYVGSTQVATVQPAWTTTPDNTTTFAVLPGASAWDEKMSDHTTTGTTGATLNAAGAAGDPWATALPGSYSAGQAGFIVGTNLDATVSSRSTLTQTQVTGGAYSVQSSSCVLGDARVAHLDANVSSRMATYTQPTGFLAATFPSGTLANTTNITAGTITTVTTVTTTTTATNLTNAPTSGNFTAAMKTSLNNATPAVTVSDKTGFKLASDGLALVTAWTVDVTGHWIGTVDNVDQVGGNPLVQTSGKLWVLDGSGNAVAPAATALSTAQWTNTRAGLLDHLDANVSSRMATFTLPAHFADLAITVTTGQVTVGTNNDKTGYALTSAYDPAKTAAQAGDAMTLTAAYDAAKTAAQAATALSTVNWTNTRAGLLDHLDADVSSRSTYAGANTSGTTTLLARLTSTRASYLDNLSGGAVALAGSAPSWYTTTVDISNGSGSALVAATAAQVTSDHGSGSYVRNTEPDNSSVAAIKAQTDNLPASPAATGDPMTLMDGAITEAKITVPSVTSGQATGILAMIQQTWRRFFAKVVKDGGASTIKTYADDSTTVLTTQTISSVAGVDTVGPAS